jgi:hypothetical protein
LNAELLHRKTKSHIKILEQLDKNGYRHQVLNGERSLFGLSALFEGLSALFGKNRIERSF